MTGLTTFSCIALIVVILVSIGILIIVSTKFIFAVLHEKDKSNSNKSKSISAKLINLIYRGGISKHTLLNHYDESSERNLLFSFGSYLQNSPTKDKLFRLTDFNKKVGE